MNNFLTKKDLSLLAEQIKLWSSELGFSSIGITDIDLSQDQRYLEKWLEKDYHGEMKYMERHGKKRSQPAELVEGTKRIISLSMNYLPENYNGLELLKEDKKAFVSGYARGRDYHKIMRSRLKKLVSKIKVHSSHENRVFVDSAPVLEKALAQKAGLGWIGKNTLLLNKNAGSYFFLGEIYTDLELPIDEPEIVNHCGSCTSCMDVCPTKAFEGPNQLDARKCISYLTIEYKGSIKEELRPMMGNRIFGCDDCQIFCPWNKFLKITDEADFKPRHNLDDIDLSNLFMWSEEEFLKKTQGSPIRRAGYESWLRNIAIALGNAESSVEVLRVLHSKKDDPSEIVKEHVNWAIDQHKNKEKK
ncbi:MAG: tRNA epoxyqueuosine(34) reductase QueG [SAR86 cluster bacterium]|mgnify:FL=1|jgi:epoxyqueuosine reductase|nr:tRNA epoxyqueuosine(34) reductase QueG [SAR86 cluster bacterium]|tara:strand:- start:212 stop:1288 length:1077 start_codon:yes stop_codon:yes gene_type:complete